MADNADLADIRQTEALERAIGAARGCIGRGDSESNCVECGGEIPEARRDFGGVTMCVDCAAECERMEAMRRC